MHEDIAVKMIVEHMNERMRYLDSLIKTDSVSDMSELEFCHHCEVAEFLAALSYIRGLTGWHFDESRRKVVKSSRGVQDVI